MNLAEALESTPIPPCQGCQNAPQCAAEETACQDWHAYVQYGTTRNTIRVRRTVWLKLDNYAGTYPKAYVNELADKESRTSRYLCFPANERKEHKREIDKRRPDRMPDRRLSIVRRFRTAYVRTSGKSLDEWKTVKAQIIELARQRYSVKEIVKRLRVGEWVVYKAMRNEAPETIARTKAARTRNECYRLHKDGLSIQEICSRLKLLTIDVVRYLQESA